MSQAPSGSPPRNKGLMPMAQPFFPQSYAAAPMMPYYDQHYQQGILMPMINSQQAGNNNHMWLPPVHPISSYYPCYQQGQPGFGMPFPPEHHTPNPYHNFSRYDRQVNWRPDGGTYMGHGRQMSKFGGEPSSWKSPPQHMIVPQNSPVIPEANPAGQSYHLSSPEAFRKQNSLYQPTKHKRHRGTSFPGANPPVLTFFEGSKKPDWSTYSSDSNHSPQQSHEQRPDSSENNRHIQDNTRLNNSFSKTSTAYKNLRSAPASQDARNLLGPANISQQESYSSKHQEIRKNKNRLPDYNNKSSSKPRAHIPPKFRKPYFSRSSMNIPAAPNIHWVETNRADQFGSGNPRELSHSRDFGGYSEPLSSVDSASLSPPSTSASAVKKSPSPLIVTSAPAATEIAIQLLDPKGSNISSTSKQLKAQPVSQCTVKTLGEPSFAFNPKATDFVFVSEASTPKVFVRDEYVGFYITPKTYPRTPSEDVSPITYDYDPMSWQLPDSLTPPNNEGPKICGDGECSCENNPYSSKATKLPKEFTGKTPGNMNWKNGAFNTIKDASSPRSWASWDSDDEAEILERTIGARFLSALGENKEKLAATSIEVETSLGDETFDEETPNDTEEKKFVGSDIQKAYVNNSSIKTETRQITNNAQISRDNHQSSYKLQDSQIADIETPERTTMSPAQDAVIVGQPLDCLKKAKLTENSSNPLRTEEKRVEAQQEQKDIHSSMSIGKEEDLKFGGELRKKLASVLAQETPRPALAQEMVPKEKHQPRKISVPTSVVDPPRTPGVAAKGTLSLPVFNYRDALLKKVENPQITIISTHKSLPPKVPGIIPHKPITPIISTTVKAKAGPSTEVGGRRKFFLHPIPSTATYGSIIQQLKGGMLEDIYISGLSPHPSAWKGPRGAGSSQKEKRLNRKDTKTWYCHVSFYSTEGAMKFWELVTGGKQSSGPYKSPYGGFDDQEPGFFILDGSKVLVNWRHNDQRTVNPLTLKAVTEEGATRCLLLTFNVEATLKSWGGKEKDRFFANSSKTSLSFNKLSFIKKVSLDIEAWGQADSNLQGICLINNDTPETPESAAKPTPKEIKVIVSFIKLLTAAKVKKYFSTRPEYCQNGYCNVKYYRDECSEPIDALKIARIAKDTAVNKSSEGFTPAIIKSTPGGNSDYEPRHRKNIPQTEKEGTSEENTAEHNTKTIKEKNSKEQSGKESIDIISGERGGMGKKKKEAIARGKVVEWSLSRKEKTADRKGDAGGRNGVKISDGKRGSNGDEKKI